MLKVNSILALLVLILLTSSCAMNKANAPVYFFETSSTYNSSYNEVWRTLVDLLSSRYNIKVIEQSSGIITTEDFNPNIALYEVAYPPASSSYVSQIYKYAKANLVCNVEAVSDSTTKVRFLAKYSAYDGIRQQWCALSSNGYLEFVLNREIHVKLNKKLYGYGISVKKRNYGDYIISDVVVDSPAEKAKIVKGDVVKKLNNIDISNKPYTYVFYILTDPTYDTIIIDLLHNNKPNMIELKKEMLDIITNN